MSGVMTFEAPGHTIQFREVSDGGYKRPPSFWVACTCGWSTTPENTNVHHETLARRHLWPFLDHDLEVVESGVFVRAECSCGWRSDHWHHETYRLANKQMRGEHAMHCAAVKLAAESRRTQL